MIIAVRSHIPYIKLYTVYHEPTNIFNSAGIFSLWYFHLHVSAGNPTILRVTFLLQGYVVIKCVKLLHNIEIVMIIG
jgi:hypothetical protein